MLRYAVLFLLGGCAFAHRTVETAPDGTQRASLGYQTVGTTAGMTVHQVGADAAYNAAGAAGTNGKCVEYFTETRQGVTKYSVGGPECAHNQYGWGNGLYGSQPCVWGDPRACASIAQSAIDNSMGRAVTYAPGAVLPSSDPTIEARFQKLEGNLKALYDAHEE